MVQCCWMWKCIAYRRKNFWRCLIFDEIYLQKSKKYFRGEIISYDDEGELYKGNGIVCFMIVGLKESISYVIKSLSETNTDTNWLKTELLDSIEILSLKFHWNCGFCVRAIVCNNHPSNGSSFKKLLKHVNQNPDELYMPHMSRKIYLCCNAVHSIKNVCNNLLKHKQFIFLPFEFLDLKIQPMFLEGKLHGKS